MDIISKVIVLINLSLEEFEVFKAEDILIDDEQSTTEVKTPVRLDLCPVCGAWDNVPTSMFSCNNH